MVFAALKLPARSLEVSLETASQLSFSLLSSLILLPPFLFPTLPQVLLQEHSLINHQHIQLQLRAGSPETQPVTSTKPRGLVRFFTEHMFAHQVVASGVATAAFL